MSYGLCSAIIYVLEAILRHKDTGQKKNIQQSTLMNIICNHSDKRKEDNLTDYCLISQEKHTVRCRIEKGSQEFDCSAFLFTSGDSQEEES